MPRKRKGKGRGRAGGLEIVTRDCAGIDIGKDTHYVAVDADRFAEPVRSFGAFTPDLEEMADWLSSCGVGKVAMESTSVYWIPVFEVLDRAGFEVMLVPPRMTKQISGRKSDVLDCQWIRQLLSYGLLRGAFRPGDDVCPLRSYVRQAKRLTEDRSRCVLHMQKALTEMNVRLDSVISDITGATGLRILRAIVDGERSPARLAALRNRRIRAGGERIADALQGTWRDEHLFALEQALERFDFLTQQIGTCGARIAEAIDGLTPQGGDGGSDGGPADAAGDAPDPVRAAPKARRGAAGGRKAGDRAMAQALRGMMGVDLTAIPTIGVGTALTIAAEVGPDMSAFPSAQHFSSWLGLAPGTRISGGKSLPGRPPKVVNRVAQALRMAAMSARRSQTFIGARHRARLARKDAPVAVTATARELACLVYTLVTNGEEYVERGMDAYERRRVNRTVTNLGRRARQLGYQLVRIPESPESGNTLESVG